MLHSAPATALLKLSGLLAVVFLLAISLLIYVAQEFNRKEEAESAFYTERAVNSLEKSARLTLKDYAFWGDAYKHLRIKVDTDWAFVSQNLGSTLYKDFGLQGVFVIDGAGRTVYSVIKGELKAVAIGDWLDQHVDTIINQAREAAKNETPVTAIFNVGGVPALIAAAALTPGTDPTIDVDEGPASVMVFVSILDAPKIEAIGAEYGVKGLRVLSASETPSSAVLPLGENGSAGTLSWDPEKPGQELLRLMLPLLGVAAVLVWLMTLVILRRTTLAARALDHSYASLQLSEATLTTSEERFRDVAEASSDWIWEIDSDGNFTYLSEKFEEVTGLSREDWIGAGIDSLLHSGSCLISHWLAITKRRPNSSLQCSYKDMKGQLRVTRLSAREMANNGFRGTATDVTEKVEARRRIAYLSQHDALTGLPNRMHLREFLDGKLKAAPPHEHPLVTLSFNLDRFKPVNDLLGQAAGDHVLNEVSRRLGEYVRSGDLVARVGGDEFVLILTNISTQDEVEALCRRLINSIEQPVVVNGQEVFVSASIGIAMAPIDSNQATELLRYADIALYEAKAGGRNTWRFYAGDMNAKIIEHRRLESDLRYAIKHGELRLYFQPRIRISDGLMVGAEALVRWQHPERGMIPPDIFIPIAEETGLIVPLSNWVLHTACDTANSWQKDVFVSVNLSPTEFKHGNLVARVQKALADTGLNPTRLELELTESVMLDSSASALDAMCGLKALGLRLSLDDFGTGYSSLSYLRSFPFDALKIDRSFVNKLGENDNDKSIIQAIVGLGRALSLTVTAEGIETAEQLAVLKALCCDEGQGYYLSRPLDSEALSEWAEVKRLEHGGRMI